MIQLPMIPDRKTIMHTFLMSQETVVPFFTANSTQQISLLFGLPAGYTVVGVKTQLLTQFIVPSSTSFIVQVGTAETFDFYSTRFELTNVATPTSLQITHSDYTDDNLVDDTTLPTYLCSAHDIYAIFTANGSGYISHITQGEVQITVMYRIL